MYLNFMCEHHNRNIGNFRVNQALIGTVSLPRTAIFSVSGPVGVNKPLTKNGTDTHSADIPVAVNNSRLSMV